MIIDITGIIITPGNFGEDCLGNGKHINGVGKIIECCCDECDYLLCCIDEDLSQACAKCEHAICPRINLFNKQ